MRAAITQTTVTPAGLQRANGQSQQPRVAVMASVSAPARAVAAGTEQRLSRGESTLLLGAFVTLAASLASFATL